MKKNIEFTGKLSVRVTANGCGLALPDALLFINGSEYNINKNGFSDIIPLFTSASKGNRRHIDIICKCNGFECLLSKNIPITSGYITFWNMPMTPIVKESQKKFKITRKYGDKSK